MSVYLSLVKIKYSVCGKKRKRKENGIAEPVCRAEIETQRKRKNIWIPRGECGRGGGWRWDELGD